MSDKPLPITLTGMYKGYQVAVQVESTLDSLDRLIERLKARGIMPLAQAAPSGASKGSGKKERIAGKLTQTLTMKLNVYKFELAPDDGGQRITCAMLGNLTGWQDEAFQNQHMALEGKWTHSEEWGSSFVVSKVIEAERRNGKAA